MSKKYNISKQFLIEEYIINKKPQKEIAKELGYDASTIGRHLKRYNIKIRSRKEVIQLVGRKGKLNGHFIDGRTLKKYYCKDCDKEISLVCALYGQGRCNSCAKKELFKDPNNNPNWQNGKSFEEYGADFDNTLKEQVRFREGYKCQICGCSQLENGRQLDCHHIDYNKKHNFLNNLIALCHSCHMKTNGNREEWTEYFQAKVRRKING